MFIFGDVPFDKIVFQTDGRGLDALEMIVGDDQGIGRNSKGQVGNGNTADSLIPVNAPQSREEMFTKAIQEHNPLKIRLKNSSAIWSILGLPRFPFFTTK